MSTSSLETSTDPRGLDPGLQISYSGVHLFNRPSHNCYYPASSSSSFTPAKGARSSESCSTAPSAFPHVKILPLPPSPSIPLASASAADASLYHLHVLNILGIQ